MPDVLPELSAYVLPGRATDPARGITEAQDAEKLGLSRVWLSERYDIKDAGVLCGAVGARTERIGIATGVLSDGARPPLVTASLGGTMQASFGDRFTLGMGRGTPALRDTQGIGGTTFEAFEDYCTIMKRLWAGETVSYDGPAGRFPALSMRDVPQTPPQLYYGTFGMPRGIELAGRLFDGLCLGIALSADAVHRIKRDVRRAAEQAGRDPEAVRVCATLITAPDVDETTERLLIDARMITYLDMRGIAEVICRQNGWDTGPMHAIRNHPKFATQESGMVDQNFHRRQLLDVADLVPRRWIAEAAAVGTARECAGRVAEYLDAGADEVILHASAPAQNAGLIAAYRALRRG